MLVRSCPIHVRDRCNHCWTHEREEALKPLRCPLSASRARAPSCVAPAIGAAFACSSLNSVSIVNTLFISMHPAERTPYEAPAYAAAGSCVMADRSPLHTLFAKDFCAGTLRPHHVGPGLRNIARTSGDVEMLHHHSRWRMRQPVGQRNFGIVIGLEISRNTRWYCRCSGRSGRGSSLHSRCRPRGNRW